MRTAIVTILCVVLMVSFFGCSTNKPAPLGDELLWSSNGSEGRPAWTLNSERKKGDGFVGQSLFHATERSALRNAELDACRQMALSEKQQLQSEQSEKMNAQADEKAVLDAKVQSTSTVIQSADTELLGVTTQKTYLEQWRLGNKILWKAFVLVQKDN